MRTITTTDELAAFCEAAKSAPYVTIDTEFLRERTYWSKLCLIQMALPGKDGDAVLVDPILGEDMSLEPLYDLFRHEATVKVFHAARQAHLNVLLAGHYQTEVWGVRALMPVLEEQFGVRTRFVDIPTGF